MDHAVFFAEIRSELIENDPRPLVVPRSFRAAMLAGLVVACCLGGLTVSDAMSSAGLDTMRLLTSRADLRAMLGFDGGSEQALPYMLALSLLSGARIAVTTLLAAHRVLQWVGLTGHLAYAAAGAAMTAACSVLVLIVLGHPPQHGWLIDLAGGAGAGFFYRMFAGAARR